MDEDEKKTIRRDFDAAVNMSPKELEEWLETEQSRSVGAPREARTRQWVTSPAGASSQSSA